MRYFSLTIIIMRRFTKKKKKKRIDFHVYNKKRYFTITVTLLTIFL